MRAPFYKAGHLQSAKMPLLDTKKIFFSCKAIVLLGSSQLSRGLHSFWKVIFKTWG